MKFEIHPLALDGRSCWVCVPSPLPDLDFLPLAVMPAEEGMTDTLPQVLSPVERAVASGRCRPFLLAGFPSGDWHRDLTPWPALPLSKRSEAFAGNAGETLLWLRSSFLPRVESGYPVLPGRQGRSILGYSLGGLFALWALLESGEFGGCASCSGSLWYDGWADYAANREIPPNSRIYLSLGKAEENARNPRLAAVGHVTRQCAGLFEAQPNCAETALVWHEGGHFQDVAGRLAAALLWLMKP